MFKKYRVSFRLDKFTFLQERLEFVGYDLNADRNCPDTNKFDMLSDWVLPTTGQSLNSFMGLLAFYDRYVPYLEIQIKPLRQLLKAYFRKAIHPMA